MAKESQIVETAGIEPAQGFTRRKATVGTIPVERSGRPRQDKSPAFAGETEPWTWLIWLDDVAA